MLPTRLKQIWVEGRPEVVGCLPIDVSYASLTSGDTDDSAAKAQGGP